MPIVGMTNAEWRAKMARKLAAQAEAKAGRPLNADEMWFEHVTAGFARVRVDAVDRTGARDPEQIDEIARALGWTVSGPWLVNPDHRLHVNLLEEIKSKRAA